MTIKQFIECAIAGGWCPFEDKSTLNEVEVDSTGLWWAGQQTRYGEEILLDPEAWKAVGEVEKWQPVMHAFKDEEGWKYQMHRMIDALAEGKTVEQFLETL